MKSKLIVVLLMVAAATLPCLLYVYRDVTEWSTEMPDRFLGQWKLIEEHDSEQSGIRSIKFSKESIAIFIISSGEDEGEWRTFPIRIVSHTTRKNSKAGELVIFYDTVAQKKLGLQEYRMQIMYGSLQKLLVAEIVDKGWGEDHYFQRGEFVR